MPERVQMSRQHPWRAEHPDAVRIDRTGPFGNPYQVVKISCETRRSCYTVKFLSTVLVTHLTKQQALDLAVAEHARWIMRAAQTPLRSRIRAELRGRDVACWCPLDRQCHGTVTMEIANG